jgi:hypothetical protein
MVVLGTVSDDGVLATTCFGSVSNYILAIELSIQAVLEVLIGDIWTVRCELVGWDFMDLPPFLDLFVLVEMEISGDEVVSYNVIEHQQLVMPRSRL